MALVTRRIGGKVDVKEDAARTSFPPLPVGCPGASPAVPPFQTGVHVKSCFVCGQPLVAASPEIAGTIAGRPGAIALHRACAGDLAADLLQSIRDPGRSRSAAVDERAKTRRSLGLTPGDVRVLARLVAGDTNELIGRCLGISCRSARNRVSAVMWKLGAASRTEAVSIALLMDLLPPEDLKPVVERAAELVA